jgi:hypothetical protein
MHGVQARPKDVRIRASVPAAFFLGWSSSGSRNGPPIRTPLGVIRDSGIKSAVANGPHAATARMLVSMGTAHARSIKWQQSSISCRSANLPQ